MSAGEHRRRPGVPLEHVPPAGPCAGSPLAAARDVVPYLAPLGVTRLLHAPRIFTAHPGARTATTSRPQRDQPGARRGDALRRIRALRSSAARDGATPRFRAEPHGRSIRAPTRGGTTSSRTARARRPRGFFDIDWTPIKPELQDQAAAADPRRSVRPRARARASCSSRFEDGALVLRYGDHELPINPRQCAARLRPRGCEQLERTLGDGRRRAARVPEHPDAR